MKKKALQLMKERKVMIAEAIEVLSILGADTEFKTITVEKEVEKIVEVEKEVKVEVEKIVEVPVEKEEFIKDTAEIERLQQIIAEKDLMIETLKLEVEALKSRQNIVVENIEIKIPKTESVKNNNVKDSKKSNNTSLIDKIEIHSDDNNSIHGYYLRSEGDAIKKTPFTCGKKTCSPIVYGKDMMKYSDEIGSILVKNGLVKNHKINVDIHTMPINIKGKEVELMIYRDKTGALVGSVEQRCVFSKHPNCKFPLVTAMKTFISHGTHQIEDADGNKIPLIGYKSEKTHEAYKHAIASALAKFEQEEAKRLEELLSMTEETEDYNAEAMFDAQYNEVDDVTDNTSNDFDKSIDEMEKEYFAQMEAEFGITFA